MSCSKCSSDRIAKVSAKCSDCCCVKFPDDEDYRDGYVPYNVGIGGGDYIEIDWCMDCGQIQGDFPVEVPEEE